MSGLKGITTNTAPEAEAHIYAEDDAAIFQSIFGEDGVSTVGQQCKATILSNNKIRVADGVIIVGGHFARIPYGEYEDCEIANGQSGKNRNDIIVARFETAGTGGIDTMKCAVIQGTPGTEATDPDIEQENIYEGGKSRDFPLYRVKIEGLSIIAVEQMFTVVGNSTELQKKYDELNSKLDNPFITKWSYASFSVTGSSYKNVEVAIALDGYTPIAIKGFSTALLHAVVYGARIISKTSAQIGTRNLSSGTISGQIQLEVLYVKDEVYNA